jgi:HK97 gp10 family phage protein
MSVTVTVEGQNALARAFERVKVEARGALSEAVHRSAIKVRDAAKQRAPLGPTGRLKRSIVAMDTAEALAETETGLTFSPVSVLTPGEINAVVGSSHFYAPWVHFGARGSRANPFLHAAFAAESPSGIRIMADALRGVLR